MAPPGQLSTFGMLADATCDRSLVNATGAPWDLHWWRHADLFGCSCPPHLWVTAHISGSAERMRAKRCHLHMPRFNVSITVLSPLLDFPAYTAYELDRGDYGRTAVLGRRDGETGAHRPAHWVDIGANLGLLSMALALANPGATGVAYEPNPFTFAFLRHNLRANNLLNRVRVVQAGISSNGRTLHMPHCVAASDMGSQMASTQWRGRQSGQLCFSSVCKQKQAAASACMRDDPRMVDVASDTLDAVLRASPPEIDLLKVDCEGCEYEVMQTIHNARASGRAARVTGECHPIAGTSQAQQEDCARYVRGLVCSHGITPWFSCRTPRHNRVDPTGLGHCAPAPPSLVVRVQSPCMGKTKRGTQQKTLTGTGFWPMLSKMASAVGKYTSVLGKYWSGCPSVDKEKRFMCTVSQSGHPSA